MRWFLYSSIFLILFSFSVFLIINEDLSEQLLSDTVQLLNAPLEKRMQSDSPCFEK